VGRAGAGRENNSGGARGCRTEFELSSAGARDSRSSFALIEGHSN
jgi:hypothetical protein